MNNVAQSRPLATRLFVLLAFASCATLANAQLNKKQTITTPKENMSSSGALDSAAKSRRTLDKTSGSISDASRRGRAIDSVSGRTLDQTTGMAGDGISSSGALDETGRGIIEDTRGVGSTLDNTSGISDSSENIRYASDPDMGQVLVSEDRGDESNEDRTGRGMIRSPNRQGGGNGTTSPATPSELQKLREKQQADLDRLKNTYDQKARKEVPRRPDGTIDTDSSQYKKLENEYVQKRDGIRDSYTKQDPRTGDFDPKKQIPGVKSTGSKPKDVRADGDWTADTPEAADAKAKQWKDRGNNVVDEGHKIVNKTTDEVLWKPGYGPGDKSLVADGDAHGTAGGREAVTKKDGKYGKTTGEGPSDKAGATLDNEKKFLDATQRGNVKDQAKTVAKAGDATGRSQDAGNKELYGKAKDFKNYGDEISSGVSHLGEDPKTRQQKMDDFKGQLDSEMKQNVSEGARQGQQQDNTRKDLADSAKAAETAGGDKNKAWNDAKNKANYGDTPTTSEAINDRRKQVSDSNKATADANAKTRAEIEAGKAKGPGVDAPDGPNGRTGAGSDEAAGALGKAGKAIGTGMQIIDIGSTAHDIKEDLKKGDYAGAGQKGAEFVADEATMGLYSANKKIWGGGVYDPYNADRNTEKANEMQALGFTIDSVNSLRKNNVPKEEIDRLISEHNKGNDGPLYDKFRELKVAPPKWINHEYEKADDTMGERAKAFGEGFVDNAKKTGKFVKETADEAALGLGKVIYGSPDDKKVAKEVMIESLIKDGATPEGAEKAASAYYDKGDKQMLQNLKTILDKRNGVTRENDLKSAEGNNEANADGKDGKEEGGSALDKLADARNQKSSDKTRDAMGNMGANSQMNQGSTAGDQEAKDARSKVNQAGQEAQDKLDQTSKQVAAGDRKDALGNKLKDAVADGLATGGAAAGTAVGGAAADKTAGAVFGDKKPSAPDGKSDGTKSDSGSTSGEKGPQVATTKKDSKQSGGGGGKMTKSGGGGKKSSGGKEDGQDSQGKPMVTCPGCGKRFEGVAGQGVECPYCVTMTCPRCGHSKNYPRGQEPESCPMCYTTTCNLCGHTGYARRDQPASQCPNCVRVRCSGCGSLLYEGSEASRPSSIECKVCTERAAAAAAAAAAGGEE